MLIYLSVSGVVPSPPPPPITLSTQFLVLNASPPPFLSVLCLPSLQSLSASLYLGKHFSYLLFFACLRLCHCRQMASLGTLLKVL